MSDIPQALQDAQGVPTESGDAAAHADMRHTPGPWEVSEFGEYSGYDCMTGAYFVRAGRQEICDIDLSAYGQKRCEAPPDESRLRALANARLIASAPDLE